MKLLINLVMLISISQLLSCDTPSNVEPLFENYFIKYYGEDGEQSAVDLLVNADGTMILLGNSTLPSQFQQPFIVKVDPKGNVLWQRRCGGGESLNETAVDIELIKRGTRQGDLIIATNVGPESSSRIRLIRIDQQGRGIDSLMITTPKRASKQIVRSITSLENEDGFAIAGYADGQLFLDPEPITNETDQADLFAYKISDDLERMDTILIQGGEYVGSSMRVFELLRGGNLQYLVFGYSDRPVKSANVFELNMEILVTDPLSNTASRKESAGTTDKDQILTAVIQTPSSMGEGYLMAGTSKNRAASTGDIYLTKFNKNLDVRSFEKEIIAGKRLECISVAADDPFGYYVLANETTENERRNILLMQLQVNNSAEGGNVTYISKSFGTLEGDDTAGAVARLQDGRVAVLGTMELETQYKMALIILNREVH